MLVVALVVQGLVTPDIIVTSARPLATAVAPRVAVVRPPVAPVHRSRCCSLRLQTEDDEGSDGDSERPRRSAVLLRRVSDVLFLLTTIAIQAIGAASVVGRPAVWIPRPVGPASQNSSAHRTRLEAALSLICHWRGSQEGELVEASGATCVGPLSSHVGIRLNCSGYRLHLRQTT